MTNHHSSENPFLQTWLAAAEQWGNMQSELFSIATDVAESEPVTDVVEQARQHWKQCESNFATWLSATQEWFPQTVATLSSVDQTKQEIDETFEKLKLILNPTAFLSSGVGELSQAFQRLADGPDFADMGVLEKRFMRTGQDWLYLRDANAEYQSVIAKAWSRAFDEYLQECPETVAVTQQNAKELLNRWLKIANRHLVETQRSQDYLAAQRKLFKASTQYKLKQREMVEAWCEGYTMPTRSEVDDLHRMVHQLRREVRQLKARLSESEQTPQAASIAPKSTPATKTSARRAKSPRKTA